MSSVILRRVMRPNAGGFKAAPRAANLAAAPPGRRFSSKTAGATVAAEKPWGFLLAGAFGVAAGVVVKQQMEEVATADSHTVDYDAVRADIKKILPNKDYDDGSYGPVLVRLAWHAAGTYDKASGTGGSDGSTMRFPLEAQDGANAGLDTARRLLETVKVKHPAISFADLWTLASCVAIEEMGGPKIEWYPGRTDAVSEKSCPPNGRLPDAAQGAKHIRDVFYRMGFNDQEIVALIGAHTLGRCHTNRSGFEGPWTKSPIYFSNSYFHELLDTKWTVRQWTGPKQFQDPAGELMMLPADLAFRDDPEFRKVAEKYKADEDLFKKDFAAAYQKLMELGCKNLKKKAWYQFW